MGRPFSYALLPCLSFALLCGARALLNKSSLVLFIEDGIDLAAMVFAYSSLNNGRVPPLMLPASLYFVGVHVVAFLRGARLEQVQDVADDADDDADSPKSVECVMAVVDPEGRMSEPAPLTEQHPACLEGGQESLSHTHGEDQESPIHIHDEDGITREPMISYCGQKCIREVIRKKVGDTRPAVPNQTVNTIRDPHLLGFQFESASELEECVRAIFEMAESDYIDQSKVDPSNHARGGETYADLCKALMTALPTFPDEQNPDQPVTFARLLLNVTQDSLDGHFREASIADGPMSTGKRNRLIAVTSVVGHLYVRRVIGATVIGRVVHDLIGINDVNPKEGLVYCVCELMHIIGKHMDSTKQGNMLMTQFLARLSSLCATKNLHTGEPFYPKQMKDAIARVHEARFNQWSPRAGTQVLVQYSFAPRDEALQAWLKLWEDLALPHTVYEAGASEPEDLQPTQRTSPDLIITSVISGIPLAVIFSFPLEKTASDCKEEISHQTSLEPGRLMLFRPTQEGGVRIENPEQIFEEDKHPRFYDGGLPLAHL